MVTGSKKGLKDISSLVYHNRDILNALFPDKEYYIGEIAKKIDKDRSNVGKYVSNLHEADLVSIREKQERKQGKKYKYVKLTEEARNIWKTFREAVREKKKKVDKPPSDKKINFFTEQIDNPASEEVYEEATRDILKLCRETRIWEYEHPSEKSMESGKIWSFLENIIDSEDKREDGLSALLIVIENALEEDREDVINGLKALFEDKVKEFAKIDEYSTANQVL